MRSLTLTLATLLISVTTLASPGPAPHRATMSVTGRATLSASPELATLSVSVSSVCMDTIAEGAAANDRLTNQILDVLRRYKRGPNDHVWATGNGFSLETVYGKPSEVLCSRKWRADNSLTLITASLDKLGQLQAELAAVIDAEQVNPAKVKQTYAETSRFEFSLTEETTSRLRREGQNKALDDARSRFEVFVGRCGFRNASLKSISSPEFSGFHPVLSQSQQPGSAPILPRELQVTTTVSFQWEFEHNGTCLL